MLEIYPQTKYGSAVNSSSSCLKSSFPVFFQKNTDFYPIFGDVDEYAENFLICGYSTSTNVLPTS